MVAKWCYLTGFLLVVGCGGQPIGQHIPRVSPKKVAVGAAAAATALTLANPDAAGKRPEGPGDPARNKPIKNNEVVPSAALDRLDESPRTDDDEPCAPPGPAADANPAGERAKPSLELIPNVVSKNDARSKKPPRAKCDDDEDSKPESPPEPSPP